MPANTPNINETHDPNLKSWVESANDPATDFPIQNLPFVSTQLARGSTHIGVVIGDQLLDLHSCFDQGLFFTDELAIANERLEQEGIDPFTPPLEEALLSSDSLMTVHPRVLELLRRRLVDLLRFENARALDERTRAAVLRPLSSVGLASRTIPNYTDFYASKHHATNVGAMFRPDNPLLPNYKHVPIGYHGRASSIVPSGTPIRRPSGQQSPPDDNPAAGPTFGPCKMLDYEMELGVFIGKGNPLGQPIPMSQVRDHIFGFCLVNDWSARDMQKWEYQPLGPFLAKNFATSISPYIVTMEALEPFRVAGPSRDPEDPQPLPYLRSDEPWGLDVNVEVFLASRQMRDRGLSPVQLSKGNSKDLYWTLPQMIVHHASNGCNLQPGDLLASGTISGREEHSRGCLLELTWQGLGPDKKPLPRKPITLPTGETRLFLQDGDEIIMKAFCQREGFRRIGFGECRGIVEPAL